MPKLYDEKIKPFLPEIINLRARQVSTAKIAEFLEIEPFELELAIQDNTDLYNAWYKGEMYLKMKLEESLYRAGIGHYVEETEEITTTDKEGNTVTTVKVKKKWIQSVPAALRALEVIYKNRWAQESKSGNEIEIILPQELLEYSE